MIEVPHTALSPEALRGVIAEYVSRAGTDYGAQERSIDQKIADVERQLERGEAIIVFDPDAETTNILPACETATSASPDRGSIARAVEHGPRALLER